LRGRRFRFSQLLRVKNSSLENTMKISHGLLNGQVLQRDNYDRGSATVRGTSRIEGVVEARVSSARGVLRGLDWKEVGSSDGRQFEATLQRIPVGGPYTVELSIAGGQDELTLEDVYVGDVWILAGQSNMQGVGNMEDAPKPHPLIRAFYMRDEWGLAEEPLHFLAEAVDSFHNDGNRVTRAQANRLRREAIKGVCPGIFFGREMIARTKVPQGLVLCAHGGTSMAQWSPDLKERSGSMNQVLLKRQLTLLLKLRFASTASSLKFLPGVMLRADCKKDTAESVCMSGKAILFVAPP
jgi:sialate O-acetylesterase